MADAEKVKIVVFVPETHANAVREAAGAAGAGVIGNYTFCSFSSKGVGRFRGGEGASPVVGETGRLEAVPEERIEALSARADAPRIIRAIKKAHPYEEVPIDVYSLLDM